MNYELIKPRNQADEDFLKFESSLLEMQMNDVSETVMNLQYKAMGLYQDLYHEGKVDSPELNDLLLRIEKAGERYRELKNSHSDNIDKVIQDRKMDRVVIERAGTEFKPN
ncbi:MAG: hypothetical protein KBB54_01135 [Candidatus Pacebacteria bacterium]|nr:hypothetical protein [Candidatus Paceibacterota bacterium]MBP9818375.1 hypothetical protein [Candidatus Paceibacterota bacterium]